MEPSTGSCVVCGDTFTYERLGRRPKTICSDACRTTRRRKAGVTPVDTPTTAVCHVCGGPFEYLLKGKPRTVCSTDCVRRRNREAQSKGCAGLTTGTCQTCGTDFKYERVNQARKFCSDGCKRQAKNAARRQGLLGPAVGSCRTCGRPFEYDRSSRERMYCSISCIETGRRTRRLARLPEVLVAKCVRCGRSFGHTNRRLNRGACSDECRKALRVAARARYNETHKEQRAAYNREWFVQNRDRHDEATRRWRERNPEKVRAAARKRVVPRAMKRELLRRYRARRKGLTVVSFTQEQLAARLSMFPGCWICGGPWVEIDHVKPLSKGGAHILANLRPACRSCNARKRDRWPWLPAPQLLSA